MNEIFCVDPAIKTPETESFNLMMSLSPLNVSYHLPAQQGMTALLRREQMTSIKGIVLLGSACSVHDQLPWQAGLHQWVQKKLTTHLPILAICYGHQLIAHLLGASVENTAKPYKGFRQITLLPNTTFAPDKQTGQVVVSHREEVTSLPPNMSLLAKSNATPFEALYHHHYPIWTFQSHIEANQEFCQHNHVPLTQQTNPFDFGQYLLKTFIKKVSNSH